MIWILKQALQRLKGLLLADAALDLEAEFAARHAHRKAELLRLAREYEEQNLGEVADELRQNAENLATEKPLTLALPSLADLTGAQAEPQRVTGNVKQSEAATRTPKNGVAKKPTKKRASAGPKSHRT